MERAERTRNERESGAKNKHRPRSSLVPEARSIDKGSEKPENIEEHLIGGSLGTKRTRIYLMSIEVIKNKDNIEKIVVVYVYRKNGAFGSLVPLFLDILFHCYSFS